MKPNRTLALAAAFAAVAFAAGVLLARATRDPPPQMLLAGPEPPPGAPAPIGVPRSAPAFAFVDQDGGRRSLGEYRGRWVVVNFWATWCPPCLVEIPLFVDLQTRYRERGVQFVGVAVDEREPVIAFARENGMNYPTMAAQEDALDLMRAYGNSTGGLPYTVLVSPEGEVVDTRAGAFTPREAEDLLARSVAGS